MAVYEEIDIKLGPLGFALCPRGLLDNNMLVLATRNARTGV